MINYIQNKQARLISATTLDFTREIYIEKLNSKNRLVGLVGQRGVGKTTLLLQYLKTYFKPTKYLYFSADDVHITDNSIYSIVEEFVILGGKVIVIDEIHKYNNWAIELKSIYDSYPELLVRFSGSSMLNILSEKYDLSRRCVISHVKELNFKEYLKLSNNINFPELSLEEILSKSTQISPDLALSQADLYKHFLKYLQIGSYPFFIEDEVEYKNKLFNALDKIINEDIPSLNKLDYSHLSIFKKIIAKLIYSRVPYKVNITTLCKEFGISHPTLNTYLNIYEQTKIIKPIKKYSTKLSLKPQKLLFGNTNILHTYSNEFGVEIDIGTLRETFFASCFPNIYYSDIGDFKVGDYIFEIGGKNKSFKQIKDISNSFAVIDTDYSLQQSKIPLWLFGLIK
ncbi:MAG: ATPase component BioM of energizing module of biotin ECF transporter [uncultured Campylobacterales bacterium]|uniref:ATPase component BioM of energizing module of biotin ECF transporter n=1 Tax=uncultured Campylobacterales bacterium TaxID=352960 RepID=A0A6S6SIX0_9BACT|nr:MAG: ATPase component BioM of energizing module of biotin ECF transporter [uncultured Campylobacterales bacterium]